MHLYFFFILYFVVFLCSFVFIVFSLFVLSCFFLVSFMVLRVSFMFLSCFFLFSLFVLSVLFFFLSHFFSVDRNLCVRVCVRACVRACERNETISQLGSLALPPTSDVCLWKELYEPTGQPSTLIAWSCAAYCLAVVCPNWATGMPGCLVAWLLIHWPVLTYIR